MQTYSPYLRLGLKFNNLNIKNNFVYIELSWSKMRSKSRSSGKLFKDSWCFEKVSQEMLSFIYIYHNTYYLINLLI